MPQGELQRFQPKQVHVIKACKEVKSSPVMRLPIIDPNSYETANKQSITSFKKKKKNNTKENKNKKLKIKIKK